MNRSILIAILFISLVLCLPELSAAQEKPEPPTSLSAGAVFGSKSIKLTWNPSATDDVAFYKIYRSTLESSVGSRINIISSESVEYIDTDILYDREYYYTITSEVSDIESDYSNTASAKAGLPIPINAAANDIDAKVAIRVSWSSSAPGLLLWYDVYRSTSLLSVGSKIKTKMSGTEYEDAGLTHNTTYYYRIRSVDADGIRSDYSEPASAKAIAEFDTFEPRNVKTSILSNNGVKVSWSAPEHVEISSYLVYRSTSETDLGSLRAEVSNRSFSEYALPDGFEYYYSVKTVLEDGKISSASESMQAKSKSSSEDSLVPPVIDFSAQATGKSGEIKLKWTIPSSSNFSFARIYRGTKSEAGNSLVADKIKGTSFIDKKLDDGFTYYYTIRTVSKNGTEGARSDEVYAASFIKSKADKTPPPVLNLRIQDVGDGKTLKLTWNNPASYEYTYIKIYRSESKDNPGVPIKNRLRVSSFADSEGITASQRYYYMVKTVDSNGVESEDNIFVRGIATTALEGEMGENDADSDGLPDMWERQYGYNAHLKDLIDEDEDNDGLSVYDEYKNGTNPWNPDSDNDGYTDGTEVLNRYNPLGPGPEAQVKEIIKKVQQGEFAYNKQRLSSLGEEAMLARELKTLLEYEFGVGRIPNPKHHWPKLVNAYVYGGYTSQEIAHTLRYGPGLVHPAVSADAWRASDEYKRKQ
ncbi:hypothetical protein KKF64_02975 [Patescibacteria group bacterium]|nr:hypothetical protein [Patescibacteria group bacterium]